jgi:hypothetical protein
MTVDPGDGDRHVLSPDEAFSLLGNETRLKILQTLGEHGGSLSFTDLRDEVGIRQGAQFNYHLDKLVGHFVRKTETGYALRQPGRRVVQAILSGAVTERPELEPTEIDFACPLCGDPIEVGYEQERVELYCTTCRGHFGDGARTRDSRLRGKTGYLGSQPLPPAGLRGRTPDDVLRAASMWGHVDFLALAHDVCPRCSAVVEHSVRVCETHTAADGLCAACDRRHRVQINSRCTNCVYEVDGPFVNYLVGNLELRRFVAEQGIDPIVDGVTWGSAYGEDVASTDPFEACFTFAVDGRAISLTVADDLSVVEVARRRQSDPD